jgi:hypothetical protein
MSTQIITDSFKEITSSSLVHQAVDLASVNFTAARPFKGIHVGTAGNVTIVGLDGKATTFALEAGGHPYGGTGIIRATTTASNLVALF